MFLGRTAVEPTAPEIKVQSNGVCAPNGSANNDQIARVLLEAVAEKTGYPVDMLELDMRLDADLGIDSIKRVEILSAVQDRLPEAPTLQPEQLGTLATLRQIVESLATVTPPCPAAATANADRSRYAGPSTTNGVATKAPSENGIAVHGAKENGVRRRWTDRPAQVASASRRHSMRPTIARWSSFPLAERSGSPMTALP